MNNYFSHDSNARNSDKLIPLRMRWGAEGYGIYFMILERLREEPEYTSVKDYNMIAFDLRVDTGKVKSVIEDFGLFVFTEDGKYFYSESFKRRMTQKDEKSKKLSEAGKKGNERRWKNNAGNQQENHQSIATQSPPDRICDENLSQEKKRKEKERKEKESKDNITPLSPNGDIPQGELEFPLDENFESPVKPPGEKEKSSAKKEKESDRELVNKIVNYYHEKCPGLATVKTITDKRVSTEMARVRQHGKDKVAEMIERAGASNFLAGDNQRGWIADFDWIFKPTNFVKVYEGKYDNRNRTSKELPASGREGVVGNGNNPRWNDAENKRAERDALGEIARQVLHRSMPKEF